MSDEIIKQILNAPDMETLGDMAVVATYHLPEMAIEIAGVVGDRRAELQREAETKLRRTMYIPNRIQP